jgi:hypothetical protein
MQKTVEIRVRPVVRYVVTRYESGTDANGMGYGGCETVGEFDNERSAEFVAMALREAHRQGLADPKSL